MSLTYGFYNAIDHDRTYDATQMSSLFDGIIKDGVFQSIGTAMSVRAGSGMQVTVGLGRAWFDHTWTNNDSLYVLDIGQSEATLKRLDAVVLEVNNDEAVRANSFKVIQGTPSTQPTIPALVNTENIHQHLLATVLVEPRVTSITDSKITNYIGTSQTPFVTGILETLDITALTSKWDTAWNEQFNADKQKFDNMYDTSEVRFNTMYNESQRRFNSLYESRDRELVDLYNTQDAKFLNWYEHNIDTFENLVDSGDSRFNSWFMNLQNQLDDNQAANLQRQIDALKYIYVSNDVLYLPGTTASIVDDVLIFPY